MFNLSSKPLRKKQRVRNKVSQLPLQQATSQQETIDDAGDSSSYFALIDCVLIKIVVWISD